MVTNNKGLTLLEILVAVVLLALVVAGLGAIFVSSKSYVIYTRSFMAAAESARYFLDPLRADVRNDTWASSWLASGVLSSDTFVTTQNTPGAFNYSYNAIGVFVLNELMNYIIDIFLVPRRACAL